MRKQNPSSVFQHQWQPRWQHWCKQQDDLPEQTQPNQSKITTQLPTCMQDTAALLHGNSQLWLYYMSQVVWSTSSTRVWLKLHILSSAFSSHNLKIMEHPHHQWPTSGHNNRSRHSHSHRDRTQHHAHTYNTRKEAATMQQWPKATTSICSLRVFSHH